MFHYYYWGISYFLNSAFNGQNGAWIIRENRAEAIYFSWKGGQCVKVFRPFFTHPDAGHLEEVCRVSLSASTPERMSPTSHPFWSARNFVRTSKPRRLDVSSTHRIGGDDILSRHIAQPEILIHHGSRIFKWLQRTARWTRVLGAHESFKDLFHGPCNA